jgi:putative OPT family oligopeptide transporter
MKASFGAFRGVQDQGIARTEHDTPMTVLLMVTAVMTVPVFFMFQHALADYPERTSIALLMTVLMLIFGFLFSAVAGYMAGLVGSSNNPVSGVTMATVVVSSLLLVQLIGNEGIAGKVGPIAVIYLAAVICTAACIAGDNLQDLKCGHVVGSTPWKQQVCLVLGALVSASVIPIVLGQLDDVYGIGRVVHEGTRPLAAPQATLMMTLATGIFGSGIDWTYIQIGCALAVLIIALDKVQERRGATFRLPVLAVAVGIYLPFGLSVLIFVGGLLSWLVQRQFRTAPRDVQLSLENNGLLLASGLITGEAIMGVGVTFWAASRAPGGEHAHYAAHAAIAVTVALMAYLYWRTLGTVRR